MNYSELEIGTTFYYTGARGKAAGFGKITDIIPSSAVFPYPRYTITLDDGRQFRALSKAEFDNSPGRRFIPRAKYEAKLKAQTEKLLRVLVSREDHEETTPNGQ